LGLGRFKTEKPEKYWSSFEI